MAYASSFVTLPSEIGFSSVNPPATDKLSSNKPLGDKTRTGGVSKKPKQRKKASVEKPKSKGSKGKGGGKKKKAGKVPVVGETSSAEKSTNPVEAEWASRPIS